MTPVVLTVVDPVCGMTFHFCGEACRKQFLSEHSGDKSEETSGGYSG